MLMTDLTLILTELEVTCIAWPWEGQDWWPSDHWPPAVQGLQLAPAPGGIRLSGGASYGAGLPAN